jgi:hypothetical protein
MVALFTEYAAEAKPLHEELVRIQDGHRPSARRRSPDLAESPDRRSPQTGKMAPSPGSRAENAFRPQGVNPKQSMALSRISNPGAPGIRHLGVAPLIYEYGEKVITPRERQAREAGYGTLLTHS